MRQKYLVMTGFVGCLQDSTTPCETLSEAKRTARWYAQDYREQGYPVVGNANYAKSTSCGVVYAIGTTGMLYVEIVPVTADEYDDWSEA